MFGDCASDCRHKNMSTPVKCEILSKDTVDQLRAIYKEEFDGLARYGEVGYLLPARYKPHADAVRNMLVRADDVWLLTFPRSGTHMTAEILWLLENNLDYKTAFKTPLSERNIFLETFSLHGDDAPIGYQLLAKRPSPRLISTHLALSLLPPTLLDTARVIFVARDPRDVAVSYYNFYKQLKNYGRFDDFKQFWELFVEDLIVFTPFFPLLKEAWAKRSHPNMLFLFYEDIVKDMPAAVRRISKFLGKDCSTEEVERLCKHMDIDTMRTNTAVQPTGDVDGGKVFVRQGKAGGWKSLFDGDLRAQADDWIHSQLNDTNLRFYNQE